MSKVLSARLHTRYVAPQAAAPVGGLDVERRRATFIASCGTVDDHGTSLVASGLDLERLRANPLFLWMHRTDDPDDTIGRLVSIDLQGDQLVVVAEFGTTELAERCWRAVVDGRINGVSIRFKTLSSHFQGDVEVIDRAEVYECSLVLLPSNPDCLAIRSYIEGSRMNPDILKTLGLDEKATPEDVIKALVSKLAVSDEDKALADGVMKMLGDGAEARADAPPPAADKPADSASSASDGAAREADEADKEEMRKSIKTLSERVASLEKSAKPENLAAAVRAIMAQGKPATKPATSSRGLGLRFVQGGNPAGTVTAPAQNSDVAAMFNTVDRAVANSTLAR